MLTKLCTVVSRLLTRRRVEQELDEELRFHVDMEADAHVRRGLPESEARRQALLDLGGIEQTRFAVREVRADVWDAFGFQLRLVSRSLRRSPAFSVVVTAVLAIGIAGATVVYSVAQAVLFRPIPYADPDSLYLVSSTYSSDAAISSRVIYFELFEQLREGRGRSLLSTAAYSSRGANLSEDGWSERWQVGAVSPDFLTLVGVRPYAGRGFTETEFRAGEHRAAILSHALWQARFGGAPDAIGMDILIDDKPFTVVGVLPETFRSFDELETATPAAWNDSQLGVLVPLLGDPFFERRSTSAALQKLQVVARLREGQSLDEARQEVEAVGRRLQRGPSPARARYGLVPIGSLLSHGVPTRMGLLGAAVAVLLVLACANSALLLLQRRESRRRELQIRAALGATRTQLVAEALVEALLLAISAWALSVLLAWQGMAVARTVGGAAVSALASVQLEWRDVLFALMVSLGTALVASLGSCLRLLKSDMPGGPAEGSARLSLPSWLVMAQVGLSVGLVVVCLLLARDFARQSAVDLGYEPKGVLTARVAVSPGRYVDRGGQFFDRLITRLRDTPGVNDAALVYPAPGAPFFSSQMGRVEGYGDEPIGSRVVSGSYFALLRIQILAGRPFTESDVRDTEVGVVVNSTFADKYWGKASAALGRRIALGLGSDVRARPSLTIVGVAHDIREATTMARPEMYLPYSWAVQHESLPEMSILVRGQGELAGLGRRLRRASEEVDAYQPLYGVRPLEDLVRALLVRTRVLVALVAVFSVLATVLAGIGVYVVLAFAVTRRTQEFGVRLALGASRLSVFRAVIGRTLGLLGKGVALTLPLTFGATWLFAAQLLGVTETDPITCLWALGIVSLAALLASVVPAWRAIRVDPLTALRHE